MKKLDNSNIIIKFDGVSAATVYAGSFDKSGACLENR